MRGLALVVCELSYPPPHQSVSSLAMLLCTGCVVVSVRDTFPDLTQVVDLRCGVQCGPDGNVVRLGGLPNLRRCRLTMVPRRNSRNGVPVTLDEASLAGLDLAAGARRRLSPCEIRAGARR